MSHLRNLPLSSCDPHASAWPQAPLSKALPLVDWSYVARFNSPFPLAVEQRMAFKVLEDWMPHDEWKWTVWVRPIKTCSTDHQSRHRK